MNDGYSTAGTMGGGLGAMRRIASGFEVFTAPGGTIVFLELGLNRRTRSLQVAGMAVPYPGERVCGDAWACHRTPQRTVAFLADGLGHGWGAAEAAQEAADTFQRYVELSPASHPGLRSDSLKKDARSGGGGGCDPAARGDHDVRGRGQHFRRCCCSGLPRAA